MEPQPKHLNKVHLAMAAIIQHDDLLDHRATGLQVVSCNPLEDINIKDGEVPTSNMANMWEAEGINRLSGHSLLTFESCCKIQSKI